MDFFFSLDRNAIHSICQTLGKGNQAVYGGHGFSTCYLPDLDFQLEVWFHFGIQEHYTVEGNVDYVFEDLMSSRYLPQVRNTTRSPDLIIFASGAWDQAFLTWSFPAKEDLGNQNQVDADHSVALIPWEAYAYQRRRLTEMVAYLRSNFPDAPLMYRPETYYTGEKNKFNAMVFNLRESAIATMNALDVPIFSCESRCASYVAT